MIAKEILLNFITILHIIFVLFVVITPFTNSTYFLMLHLIIVPFVMMHWLLNDNTCVLTVVERKLRKEVQKSSLPNGAEQTEADINAIDEECITCKLIEPVYDFRKNYETFSKIIYAITIALWLITVFKLVGKYRSGEIGSFKDLFNL